MSVHTAQSSLFDMPPTKKLHTHFLDPNDSNGSGIGHHHRQLNQDHVSPVSDLPHDGATRLEAATHIAPPSNTSTTSLSSTPDTTHILVAATGSVASVKIPLLVRSLLSCDNVEVQVVVTKSGKKFFDVAALRKDGIKVWEDEDEWTYWHGMSDPVLHIELRRWAHLLLIAPLSANTLSSLAYGMCNNLLTNTIRAWDPTRPILVAPAMNTYMYNHPITKKQLKFIKDEMYWVEVIQPIEKVLACKEVGMGGMAEWGDIVGRVIKKFHLHLKDDEDDVDEPTRKYHRKTSTEFECRTGNGGENDDAQDETQDRELVNTTSNMSL